MVLALPGLEKLYPGNYHYVFSGDENDEQWGKSRRWISIVESHHREQWRQKRLREQNERKKAESKDLNDYI